jgi:hypothetical protein
MPTESPLQDAFHWAFGRGFWYADPVAETRDWTDDELLWSPGPNIHTAFWHLGHIAHRERVHIAVLLEGREQADVIPPPCEIFGCGVGYPTRDELLRAVGTVDYLRAWVRCVRDESHSFLDSLAPDDFARVPGSSAEGNSIARVLAQTVGHTALHLGRIQLLRALMKSAPAGPSA